MTFSIRCEAVRFIARQSRIGSSTVLPKNLLTPTSTQAFASSARRVDALESQRRSQGVQPGTVFLDDTGVRPVRGGIDKALDVLAKFFDVQLVRR